MATVAERDGDLLQLMGEVRRWIRKLQGQWRSRFGRFGDSCSLWKKRKEKEREREREREREMSLVDYASSSSEDEDDHEQQQHTEVTNKQQQDTPTASGNERAISLSHPPSVSASHSATTSREQLPDASMLLNSPAFSSQQMSGSDHYSRVAAAMAESASRKRESNGSASSHPRSKYPRSNMPHSRNVPDTAGGLLVPPQLSGRRNVVTEDLGRLFTRRNDNPSSLLRSPEQPS